MVRLMTLMMRRGDSQQWSSGGNYSYVSLIANCRRLVSYLHGHGALSLTPRHHNLIGTNIGTDCAVRFFDEPLLAMYPILYRVLRTMCWDQDSK
jgi:hypothetical protein